MLKGNLSSRPFYNERLVNLLLLVAAIVGVVMTLFNVTTIIEYSGERTRRTVVQRDAEAKTAQLKSETDKELRSVDRNALAVLGYETAEANLLIEGRLFSWTVFFGLVEKAIPLDVRLIGVSPHVEKGNLRIDMTVNAKRRDDLAVFLDALQNTGSFYDVNAGALQRNDDGSYDATLSAGYLAPQAQSSKVAGAAGGAKRP